MAIIVNQQPQTYHAGRQNKPQEQTRYITRLIYDIAYDIKRRNKSFKLPSTWLLKNLVTTHYCEHIDYNWRSTVASTLKHIANRADPTCNPVRRSFTDLESGLPLFPNNENFTIKDTLNFCKAINRYLLQVTPR